MRGSEQTSEQDLRAKAAVPDVNSGLFRSFLVRIRKKAHHEKYHFKSGRTPVLWLDRLRESIPRPSNPPQKLQIDPAPRLPDELQFVACDQASLCFAHDVLLPKMGLEIFLEGYLVDSGQTQVRAGRGFRAGGANLEILPGALHHARRKVIERMGIGKRTVQSAERELTPGRLRSKATAPRRITR
jgi:hypothetical protein